MSDEEATPRTGGALAKLLKPFLDHLRENHGPEAIRTVGEALTVDLEALANQRGAMISLDFIERFCEAVARLDRRPGLFFQVGQRSWSPAYMEDHWLVMKLGGTVQLAYEGLFNDFALFNQVGSFEIDERRPGSFQLRYVPRPGVARERVPHVCEARMGQLSAVPTVFDRPCAQVVQHACMADGAPHCSYSLTFDASLDTPMGEASQRVMLDIRAKVCDTLMRYDAENQRLAAARREVERQVELRTEELSTACRQLQDAHAEIRGFDKARNDFMLGVSHDLRSPLQVILSSCELLLSGSSLGDEERELVDAAAIHAKRLARLCSQLEELGMMRLGARRSVARPFVVSEVVDAVASAYAPLARRKGQTLKVRHHGPSLPTVGHAARLDAALANLLNNAMRVTPAGGTIRIERWEDEDALCLQVSDDGPGVPADRAEAIFKPFIQGGGDAVGHLGLGLAIVQSVMAEHAGEVTLASEPGQGAAFTLRFPRQRPTLPPEPLTEREPPSGPIAEAPLQGRAWEAPHPDAPRLLVVEDCAARGEGLGALLSDLAQVRWVGSAALAMDLLEEEPPDLLIFDLDLPAARGLALCRQARARLGPRVVILYLSARHAAESMLEAFEAGADDAITRPFLPPVLHAQVRSRLRRQALA